MSEQIEPVQEKIIDILRMNGVKSASFGSIVRGEMTDESDVDLLVEFEGRRSLLDLAHLKNELEDAVERRASPRERQIAKDTIKFRYMGKKISSYSREG